MLARMKRLVEMGWSGSLNEPQLADKWYNEGTNLICVHKVNNKQKTNEDWQIAQFAGNCEGGPNNMLISCSE